jgi:hypothetical protein
MATQAARLWLPVETNNSYRQALSIPLDDFQHFSLNDLPWLCYVAYTIYGREGHISLTPHGTEIDEGEDVGPNKYYYVSRGVSHLIVQECLTSSILPESALLLDPDMMDDRTSISIATSESTSWSDFRQRVTARDETCVLTHGEENLTACHIVPHAKTHQVCSEYISNHSGSTCRVKYMVNLSNYRWEDVDPPLDDINDTRNGILLYSAFHRAFAESRVAFLRVSYCCNSFFFLHMVN